MMTLVFPELEMQYGGIVAESLDAAGIDGVVRAGIDGPDGPFDEALAATQGHAMARSGR